MWVAVCCFSSISIFPTYLKLTTSPLRLLGFEFRYMLDDRYRFVHSFCNIKQSGILEGHTYCDMGSPITRSIHRSNKDILVVNSHCCFKKLSKTLHLIKSLTNQEQ